MYSKKMNKMISFITHTFLFSTFLNQCVFATDTTNPVNDILIEVTRVLLVIGGLVCIGKLVQIGIMYMMTSVDQKSQAKTAVLPWLVGTIVCFGAAWIGSAIIGIVSTGNGDVLSSY